MSSEASDRECSVCAGPISTRNKIGICRANEACKKAAKKIHDRNFHQAKVRRTAGLVPAAPPPRPPKYRELAISIFETLADDAGDDDERWSECLDEASRLRALNGGEADDDY